MFFPKVSVIVPVYNVEKYLSRCLDSIIRQTYTNLEIICVNDGSTDTSSTILEYYSHKDERITIIDQENLGLSEARNTGLNFIKDSEYTSFIDSDDYVDPRYIQVMFNQLKDKDADFCYCNVWPFGDNIKENIDFNSWFKYKIHSPETPINPNTIPPNAWGKLFKTEMIKNIRFPKGLLHEDNYWNFLVSSYSKSYAVVKEPLYFYRRDNSNSITLKTRFNPQHLWDEIKVCCKTYEDLQKKTDNSYLLPYLDNFFFNRLDWLLKDYKLKYIPKEFYHEILNYITLSEQARQKFLERKYALEV